MVLHTCTHQAFQELHGWKQTYVIAVLDRHISFPKVFWKPEKLCLIEALLDVWVGWLRCVPIKKKKLVNFTKCLHSICHIQCREGCDVSCRKITNPIWKQSEDIILMLPRGWWISECSALKKVCLGVRELAALLLLHQKGKIWFLWVEILREKMFLSRKRCYVWHRSCPTFHWIKHILGKSWVSTSVVLIGTKPVQFKCTIICNQFNGLINGKHHFPLTGIILNCLSPSIRHWEMSAVAVPCFMPAEAVCIRGQLLQNPEPRLWLWRCPWSWWPQVVPLSLSAVQGSSCSSWQGFTLCLSDQ